MTPTKGEDTGNRRPSRNKPNVESVPSFERDLPLKLAMRRLFWSLGASTCLDVKLRAYISGDERGHGWQEFTDLDVLGVACPLTGPPELTLADCKTSNRGAIERMFWIRGVAEFFAADKVYLVRSKPVPAATRALSTRLGVGVLDPDDYSALLSTIPMPREFDGALSCLFDGESVRKQLIYTGSLEGKLKNLVDYARYDYWIYEPYRNLTQVVAHLAESVSTLDARNPHHLALFFEMCWLYSLALAYAVHHVRFSRMSDIPTSISTCVAGGELAVREKRALAELLNRAGIRVDTRSAVLPPYMERLAELVTRLLMRPAELTDVLRYAEYLTIATVVGENATVGSAFGTAHVRPIAAKLLADVCGFLVSAAGLRPEFRVAARERLVYDLTGGDSGGRLDHFPEMQIGSRTPIDNLQTTERENDALKLPFGVATTDEPTKQELR